VSLSQTQDKNGEYHDVAFPINSELHKEVRKAVLGAFKELQAEKEKPIGERLDEGMREAANKAAEKAAPQATAAKGNPGLGD
jgi:hypothetical protein